MAHYAFMNSDNVVVQVIVGVDETVEQNGVGGSTEAWEQFYQSQVWHLGLTCKRTSYNDKVRKQFAGLGFTYDTQSDKFIQPSPYASWTLDNNKDWQPPTPMPTTGGPYSWNEEDQVWVAI